MLRCDTHYVRLRLVGFDASRKPVYRCPHSHRIYFRRRRAPVFVAPETQCPFCSGRLAICETRERHVQTLTKLLHVVGKGKRCVSQTCDHRHLRYRSPEVGRLVLKAHEFGRDVVLWAGDQHVREKQSLSRIHKRLVGDFRVPISERSVGNLVDDLGFLGNSGHPGYAAIGRSAYILSYSAGDLKSR